MENVKIYESKKPIIRCNSFDWKNWEAFDLVYSDVVFNWEKSASGKMIPTDVFKHLRFSKKSLGPNFEKIDTEKICQDFVWKSVVVSTFIWD